ncbi:MAG: hypothetical protein A2Z20_01315 [Bdellovibrionales bacterium RBG_16_40_8]|nr:MAG: hypothetical protein A2Z20_01315 [Bdellovibrionales bacterium RBG_16_40_8]
MALKKNELQIYENMISKDLRSNLDWDKVIVCENSSPGDVLAIALNTTYRHICQTGNPFFIQDLNTASLMLGESDKFYEMPISSILSPTAVSKESEESLLLFKQSFNRAEQKSGIISGIEEKLKHTAGAASTLSDLLSIADELYTNAIYNAPFVNLENSVPGASRKNPYVRMHQNKSATIFLGTDSSRVVIGCADSYGSLNLIKLFKRIKGCIEKGPAAIMNISEEHGAGIGSFLIFHKSTGYYAIVEPEKRTIICCVLPLKVRNRTRLEMPKNLHFIIKEQ